MKKESKRAYQSAINGLDAAFRRARREHKEIARKYEAAKRAAEETSKLSDFDAADRLKKERAAFEYRQAVEGLRPSVVKVWDEYNSTVRSLRDSLAAALEAADLYRPGDIDANAVTLLQSGILRPGDYKAMAADFAENPTMLAMLREEARKAADAMTDESQAETRAAFLSIANEAKSSGEQLLQGFDDLDHVAKMFSGQLDGWSYGPEYTDSLDGWAEISGQYVTSEAE